MKGIVIIPAYNEAENIARVLTALRRDAPGFDCVVVNDGSSDATADVCRAQGCRVLSHAVNLGIGGAMQTGFRYAAQNGYDVAVQIDGDGQHDPACLAAMLSALTEQGADMVIGSRFLLGEGYQSTPLRRWGIRYFSLLILYFPYCRWYILPTVREMTGMIEGGLERCMLMDVAR